MVDRRQKIKKKHWLKHPKAISPKKRNLDQNINESKSRVFILIQMFQWASKFFLIADLLAESLKTNRNQQKRSLILQYRFAQKVSLFLRTSTHLMLKLICKKKPFWLECFCLVSEKTVALHHFLTPKNCILEAV